MESPTISQIVRAYFEDVSRWARERGGLPFLARDPAEPYEIIAGLGPNEFKVVVNWAGDKEFGGNVLQHLDKHSIEVWIGRGRGLAADPNRSLVYSDGEKKALLDLVESCKQRVLELKFPAEVTRKYTAYVGTDPVTTPDGISMAAYKLTFTLDVAGRELTYREVQSFNA
jgi:hypothetical protein